MKAVILAGGLGTRLAEETSLRPKPMVEVGGMPILWHVMKIFSSHGIKEFIVCLGYKGEVIKEFFANYALRASDVLFDFTDGQVHMPDRKVEDWKVTLVDTGLHSMTGGRLKAVARHLDPNETFCLTYGDGVGDVDIGAELAFHRAHGRLATVTAVTPPGRFGVLDIVDQQVRGFREKVASDQYRINAGFFVLEPGVIDLIPDAGTTWEQEPMARLAQDGQLMAFDHTGFWHPMDTLRDKQHLEELWASGRAPWKTW